MRELYADLLLLSVTAVWGMTFSIVQESLKYIEVYTFLFWRFFIAFMIMFFISKKKWTLINRQVTIRGGVLGVFAFSAFAFQTFALLYTQSSIVAFITGLNVIMVPFFLFFIFKAKIRKSVFVACMVTVLGLSCLVLRDGKFLFGTGESLTLICAVFISLHLIFTDIYSKKYDVSLLVFFQFLVVLLFSLLGALLLEDVIFKVEWFFNVTVIKTLLITSLLATLYSFWVQTAVQKYTTPTKAAIIFTAEPIFAFLYSYFIDNEVFTKLQMYGYTLIFLSILIAEVKSISLFKK